jgi:hypothetical protein
MEEVMKNTRAQAPGLPGRTTVTSRSNEANEDRSRKTG